MTTRDCTWPGTTASQLLEHKLTSWDRFQRPQERNIHPSTPKPYSACLWTQEAEPLLTKQHEHLWGYSPAQAKTISLWPSTVQACAHAYMHIHRLEVLFGCFFEIALDLCNYSLELTRLTQAGLQHPASYLSLLGTRITSMSDHVYLFVCLRQSHLVQASTELIFLFLTKEY